MIWLIICHARWEESAQALPRTPPRSLVPTGSKSRPLGTRRVGQVFPASSCSCSSTRQTKSLPVAGVETDQKLPLMVFCVWSILERWGSAADKLPDLQEPHQDCHWDTIPKFHGPHQATSPRVRLVLSSRPRYHSLLTAVANQGLHTCSTSMWH